MFKFSMNKFFYFILALFLMGTLINTAKANNPPQEINPENQLYDMQYFSISVPKGWVAQEVYGHEDVKPGQDGFIVYYNNMGERIDIFSVSFYDPQYPQYNIVVSVKNNVEILKQNSDKSINTALLQRYFEQHDFNSFSSHNGPVSLGGLPGYESTLDVSNEQGRYLTYDGKRVDADNYIFIIEHYIYNDFNEKEIARLDEVINSFSLKKQSLNVSDITPQTAEDYNNRGTDYYNQNNFTQAMSDFNKALEINPNCAPAYSNRGFLYDKQGNFTQAITDYNKALEIDSNYAPAYNNRGALYEKQGNLTQAMFDYNKAIKINPNYEPAYNNRGALYEKQDNLTLAISDCTKAIEIDPNDAMAYYNLGLIYATQGNLTQAMSNYNKAIEINPNDAKAYYYRAMDYSFLKEYDNAWSDLHKSKALGMSVEPDFLNALKKASGRDQ